VLAVLAAMCLIGAFALVVMLPPMLSLSESIARMDHMMLVGLQDLVRNHVSEWAWRALLVPLLARPSWLLPLSAGIVLGGAAVTIAWPPAASSRHRRG
jgi:hypothetical protein